MEYANLAKVVKKAILAVILALAGLPSAQAASSDGVPAKTAPGEFAELRAGRYAIKLDGLLCTACTRAIVTEISKLDAVLEASGNFEKSEVLVAIKPDAKLSMTNLRRALRKAARRADLGTKFEIASVTYRPKL